MKVSQASKRLEKIGNRFRFDPAIADKDLSPIQSAVVEALMMELNAFLGIEALVISKLKAGKLLKEKKAELRHGEWLPWIAANLPICDRTARNYIKLYDRRAVILKQVEAGDLKGISETYRAIGILPAYTPKDLPPRKQKILNVIRNLERSLEVMSPQSRARLFDELYKLKSRYLP